MTTPPEFNIDKFDADFMSPQALAYIANRLGGIEYQMTEQNRLLGELVAAVKMATHVATRR